MVYDSNGVEKIDEKLPRNIWPQGQVLEVYHNRRDGLVHFAKVKTRISELMWGDVLNTTIS